MRRGNAIAVRAAALAAALSLPTGFIVLSAPRALGSELGRAVPRNVELASPSTAVVRMSPPPTTPAPAPEPPTPPPHPAPAPPPPLPPAPALGPGWEQRRGAEALGRITYPWAHVGYTITFLGAEPGFLGKTFPASRRIEIYVRPNETLDMLTHVLAHELGHAIDKTYNDDNRRARWVQLRGINTQVPWFGCPACRDFATPAGDFAETFAYWQAGPANYSQMAPPPSAASLAQLTPLFSP